MRWHDFISNPKAITYLYNEVPPLDSMEVKSIILKSSGPTLTFCMDFPRFADNKPPRWAKESNTVSVELDFFAVKNLHIDGFSPIQNLDFLLRKDGNLISVTVDGKACHIDFVCLDISIQKVTGYINAERKSVPMGQ